MVITITNKCFQCLNISLCGNQYLSLLHWCHFEEKRRLIEVYPGFFVPMVNLPRTEVKHKTDIQNIWNKPKQKISIFAN